MLQNYVISYVCSMVIKNITEDVLIKPTKRKLIVSIYSPLRNRSYGLGGFWLRETCLNSDIHNSMVGIRRRGGGGGWSRWRGSNTWRWKETRLWVVSTQCNIQMIIIELNTWNLCNVTPINLILKRHNFHSYCLNLFEKIIHYLL